MKGLYFIIWLECCSLFEVLRNTPAKGAEWLGSTEMSDHQMEGYAVLLQLSSTFKSV